MQTSPHNEELLLHGHRVCFRRAGEGSPVLLIHGVTGNSRQWERAMPILAREHKVIAPDLLGHGQSASRAATTRSAPSRAGSAT